MMSKSDQELLLELAQGNNAALDHFFKRHSNKVYNYALKRGLNGEQSQDLVQIVFMQIYRKRIKYNPKYAALAWVYIITKSEVKDYKLRELKGFTEFDDSLSQNPGPTPILESDTPEIQHYLSDLDDREKQIIEDRYLNELEYKEIAHKLSESESNIRQIVSRSLKFLRRKHTVKPSGER